MMSGDFSFLPRSEGNNLLKPHTYDASGRADHLSRPRELAVA